MNTLEPLEEHIGDATFWPAWLRALTLKDWLCVKGRFTLALNLLGNICPPLVTARHIAPRLADKKACDEVASFICRVRDGHYTAPGGRMLKYWDIAAKKIMPLSFSKVDDTICWDAAIKLLESRGRALAAASPLPRHLQAKIERSRQEALARLAETRRKMQEASSLPLIAQQRIQRNKQEAIHRLAETKKRASEARAIAAVEDAEHHLAQTIVKRQRELF